MYSVNLTLIQLQNYTPKKS